MAILCFRLSSTNLVHKSARQAKLADTAMAVFSQHLSCMNLSINIGASSDAKAVVMTNAQVITALALLHAPRSMLMRAYACSVRHYK